MTFALPVRASAPSAQAPESPVRVRRISKRKLQKRNPMKPIPAFFVGAGARHAAGAFRK